MNEEGDEKFHEWDDSDDDGNGVSGSNSFVVVAVGFCCCISEYAWWKRDSRTLAGRRCGLSEFMGPHGVLKESGLT